MSIARSALRAGQINRTVKIQTKSLGLAQNLRRKYIACRQTFWAYQKNHLPLEKAA